MKTITFKTLSILLAAVLLVAALPVTAFAEDVSPCAALSCEHPYTQETHPRFYKYVTNEEHMVYEYRFEVCLSCREVLYDDWVDIWEESHTIDPSVDQETEMQGDCVDCGGTIYW
ncbi:MAG: hypothetical protein IKK74_09245 [Clostridia bacterium]|nr:hypothetical protein [Clostridia bacterium]